MFLFQGAQLELSMSPKSDSRLNSTVSTLTSRTPNGATQRHNVYQRRGPLALLVEVMTGLKGYYSRLCRRNTSPQSGLINIQSKPLSGWFLSLPASVSSFCAVLPNEEQTKGEMGNYLIWDVGNFLFPNVSTPLTDRRLLC